jgi:hypothetical protein
MLRERRDRAEPGAVSHREPAAPIPAALSPAGVLALQRSLGNAGVQRLIARQSPAAAPADAAREQALRDAIVAAAPSASYPAGLPVIVPQPADIDIDLTYPDDAVTRWSEVPANPANYWHWMHWGPTSVRDTEANTQAVITHELVHVKQIHGWWQDWNALDPATRDPWETYMAPMNELARLHGPQELEAYATGLDFLPNLSRAERAPALQQLFVAFLKTAQYVPPTGVTPETTTAATAPVILDAFTAQTQLQAEYGDLLWYSLIGENPNREGWLRVLRELLPIASTGYANLAKQTFYDSFLKRAGLTWTEVTAP